MNFMDNPIKNMFSTKSEPVENKVCDTSHIKHEGETYKQYGLRVAGLSEGSLHTLLPCLQSVYFGIRKAQEEDASLQDQLKKDLEAKKADFEAAMLRSDIDAVVTERMIKKFIRIFPSWESFIHQSFLPLTLQTEYIGYISRMLERLR